MFLEERVYLWDNVKAFLILLVVIGHFVLYYIGESNSFKSLYVFIWLFHMPFFIFIAGYFHKNTFIINKIYFYLILGVLLKILFFLIDKFVGKHPAFHLFSEASLPWFMFAIAAFILITYILKDIDQRLVLLFAIVIGCYSGYDKSIRDTLILSRILVFYPFYIAGLMMKKNEMFHYIVNWNKKKMRYVGLSIICMWFIFCFLGLEYLWGVKGLLSGRNPFSSSFYYYGELMRLGHYFLVVTVSFSLLMIFPNKHIKLLSVVGQRTLQIYFWHYIFLKIFLFFDITHICSTKIGKIIYIILAIILTFFLASPAFSFPCHNIKKMCFKLK